MAAPKKAKKGKTAGSHYDMKGEAVARKNKFCPKCGPGVYLAAHKDRLYCGKCHYMEKL